jgi:hypothetical protein
LLQVIVQFMRKLNDFGEAASQTASRFMRGNGGIGISGKESVGTMESFTEEQHSMTRAEQEYLMNNEEQEAWDDITKEVRLRLVMGDGNTHFGLRWECGTVDQPDFLLGGWISQASTKSFLSSQVTNGQTRFCVLEDGSRQLQQCLDATLKVRRYLNYDEIHTVRPRFQSGVWFFQIYGKTTRWELMPINRIDRDLVCRWVAALHYRSGCYDPSLAREVLLATKAAIAIQCKFRVWKAKEKMERKKERKNALLNQLATFVGFGWDAGDSDDEDFQEGYVSAVVEAASSLWGHVGSWLGLGGTEVIEEGIEEGEEEILLRDNKHKSTAVQEANDLKPLEEGEVEDEVWENQRWNHLEKLKDVHILIV